MDLVVLGFVKKGREPTSYLVNRVIVKDIGLDTIILYIYEE